VSQFLIVTVNVIIQNVNILNVIMLNVIIMNVVMLTVIMLNVIVLTAIVLSPVAPLNDTENALFQQNVNFPSVFMSSKYNVIMFTSFCGKLECLSRNFFIIV
jgi:hypothetical protein